MSLVDLERIAARADRALGRLEAAQQEELRRYLSNTLSSTLRQTERAYREALRELDRGGDRIGPSFRLARGRVLADEIEGTMRGFRDPPRALDTARIETARKQGAEFVRQTFERFEAELTISTPINHEALASVAENASTRLRRHGVDTIDRVKQEVTTGIVRGDSWTKVSRRIRNETGLMRTRADTIALTELHSAQADARTRLYGELGVQLVMRYVTMDDRTCPYCAGRQGEVTKAEDTVEVLHPRCRCVLAPYNPEWTLDGELPADELEEMRDDTLRIFREAGGDLKTGPAPFERGSRPRPVWTPGEPLSALDPWVGRAFTNLAPYLGGTGGGGGTPPPPPAGMGSLPTPATATPEELSRTLPTAVRRRLREIKEEAGDLEARVAAAEARSRAAAEARDLAIYETRQAHDAYDTARRRLWDIDRSVANARTEILSNSPELRAMPAGEAKEAAMRARIRQAFPGFLEELEEAEADVATMLKRYEEANARIGPLRDRAIEIRREVTDAKNARTGFLREQAHAVLSNESTGHPRGTISVNVRVRTRGMKPRAEAAEAWLNEHTILSNGVDAFDSRPASTLTDLKRTKSRYGRAFHTPGDGAYLAPTDGVRTYIHELGHAIEDRHESIVRRSLAYLDSRTPGEQAKRLQRIHPGHGYDSREISKPDAFGLGAYVGKIYSDATEILSMGLEHMYHDPISFADLDADHFDYVLRIMKGLPDP